MTLIKICGITNVGDARLAAELGADLLGFIGVPDTKRYVAPAAANEIIDSLPKDIKTVGVVQTVSDADSYRTDFVQYYADSDTQCLKDMAAERHIRVFRIRDTESLKQLSNYSVLTYAYLLDTYHETHLGGSGEVFDWTLAAAARELTNKPIFLAGGLNPENIIAALENVHPACVDVSSGVEATPGRKDAAKLQAFIENVRQWDREQVKDKQ